MRSLDIVGVIIDGRTEWHLPGVINDYATLCGVDGNDADPFVAQSPAEAPRAGQKITCVQCHALWRKIASLRLRARDFEVEE